jgi:hypothetical protein
MSTIKKDSSLTKEIQMKRRILFLIGVVAALLGGLWLLQGLGIVHLRPILCFANCASLQGPSATWAVIGTAVLTVGGALMFWTLKQRPV